MADIDIESRERIKGLEVTMGEVKEDVQEVKGDQRRLLWIVITFALVSGVFQYLNAGAPGSGSTQQVVAEYATAFSRLTGLA